MTSNVDLSAFTGLGGYSIYPGYLFAGVPSSNNLPTPPSSPAYAVTNAAEPSSLNIYIYASGTWTILTVVSTPIIIQSLNVMTSDGYISLQGKYTLNAGGTITVDLLNYQGTTGYYRPDISGAPAGDTSPVGTVYAIPINGQLNIYNQQTTGLAGPVIVTSFIESFGGTITSTNGSISIFATGQVYPASKYNSITPSQTGFNWIVAQNTSDQISLYLTSFVNGTSQNVYISATPTDTQSLLLYPINFNVGQQNPDRYVLATPYDTFVQVRNPSGLSTSSSLSTGSFIILSTTNIPLEQGVDYNIAFSIADSAYYVWAGLTPTWVQINPYPPNFDEVTYDNQTSKNIIPATWDAQNSSTFTDISFPISIVSGLLVTSNGNQTPTTVTISNAGIRYICGEYQPEYSASNLPPINVYNLNAKRVIITLLGDGTVWYLGNNDSWIQFTNTNLPLNSRFIFNDNLSGNIYLITQAAVNNISVINPNNKFVEGQVSKYVVRDMTPQSPEMALLEDQVIVYYMNLADYSPTVNNLSPPLLQEANDQYYFYPQQNNYTLTTVDGYYAIDVSQYYDNNPVTLKFEKWVQGIKTTYTYILETISEALVSGLDQIQTTGSVNLIPQTPTDVFELTSSGTVAITWEYITESQSSGFQPLNGIYTSLSSNSNYQMVITIPYQITTSVGGEGSNIPSFTLVHVSGSTSTVIATSNLTSMALNTSTLNGTFLNTTGVANINTSIYNVILEDTFYLQYNVNGYMGTLTLGPTTTYSDETLPATWTVITLN